MRKGGYILLLLALLLSSFAFYRGFEDLYLLSDDFSLLVVAREAPLSSSSLLWSNSFLRPLVLFSLYWDHSIWGQDAFGYHFSNVLFHALATVLVFLLSHLLLSKYSSPSHALGGALSSALLFASLACHCEAVAWVSGRCDLLATLASLSYLYFGLRFLEGSYIGECIGYLLLALLALILALASKESAITMPLVIIPWIYVHLASLRPRDCSRKPAGILFFASLVILIFYLFLRWYFLSSVVAGYGEDVHLSFPPYRIARNVFVMTASFLLPSQASLRLFFLLAVLLLGAVFLLIFRFFAKPGGWSEKKLLLGLIASLGLTLLPVLNLWLCFYDGQGERLLYLPSVFAVQILVCLLLFSSRSLKGCILLCLVLVFFQDHSLRWKMQHWKQASRIVLGTLKCFDSSFSSDYSPDPKAESLLILNLPDSCNGAYVYRNGFSQSLEWFYGSEPPEIRLLSTHTVSSPRSPVSLTIEGARKRLSLELKGAREGFSDHVKRLARASECFELLSFSRRRLELRIENSPRDREILYYTQGILKDLDEERLE